MTNHPGKAPEGRKEGFILIDGTRKEVCRGKEGMATIRESIVVGTGRSHICPHTKQRGSKGDEL